ncbi:MAG TPA: hypothetical protein VHO06_07405 [Polyangia bacterium]|nr:hypothetical protein [Polyangia bacterium]
MARLFTLVFSVSLLVFVGCGSSNPAQSDCDHLVVNVWCPKVVDTCYGYSSFSQCVSDAEAGLGCGSVTGETADLDTCDYDISYDSCSYLIDPEYGDGVLPASCLSAFTH